VSQRVTVYYQGQPYEAAPIYDKNLLILIGFQILPPGPNVIIPAVGFTPVVPNYGINQS
jgi:hypothetical protein